jgi:hypothetical protein
MTNLVMLTTRNPSDRPFGEGLVGGAWDPSW